MQQASTSPAHNAHDNSQHEHNSTQLSSTLPVSFMPAPPARLLSKRISSSQQSQLRPLPPEHGVLRFSTDSNSSNAAIGFNSAPPDQGTGRAQPISNDIPLHSGHSPAQSGQGMLQPWQPHAHVYNQQGSDLQLPSIPQWTPAAVSTSGQRMARDRDFSDKQQALGLIDVSDSVLSHPSKPSRSTLRLSIMHAYALTMCREACHFYHMHDVTTQSAVSCCSY